MTKKQMEGYQKLISKDNNIRGVGFGGGAGGGKTYLGVFWIWSMCMEYPGTRRFFARKTLKALRSTTYMSYQKMCEDMGLPMLQRGHLNGGDQVIRFYNKSEIVLVDAAPVSSDPLYLSLGGGEYTGGMIEESNELEKNGVDTLYTRIGRRKNDEYGIPPRILETFNPDKGHIYHRYYKPRKDGKDGSNGLFFVKSLATDNPMISPEYIKNLEKSPMIIKERLLYGNFDYDDTLGRLYDYNKILDLATNQRQNGKRYITCDPARLGKDKCIIRVRDGREEIDKVIYAKCTLDEVQDKIKELCQRYIIPMSNVIVDMDGLGAGIVDNIKCKGFSNGGSPIDIRTSKQKYDGIPKPNYGNLKDQCSFGIAKYINEGYIRLTNLNDDLISELDNIVQVGIGADKPQKIISKDDIKKKIGRSPDEFDSLMMRMRFELQPEKVGMTLIF